jgi:hypothetical protein
MSLTTFHSSIQNSQASFKKIFIKFLCFKIGLIVYGLHFDGFFVLDFATYCDSLTYEITTVSPNL